ncbi:MAG: hypothetical protein QOJ77_2318, partial [Microbacteriaceae bacterium]|nr:hypothetical protein [Microbacteriaceae bacterium]
IGQSKLVVATIFRAPLSGEEIFPFEFVDEHDDPAGADAQTRSQRLLTHSRLDGDQSQNSDVTRLEAENRQTFREARRRKAPDL